MFLFFFSIYYVFIYRYLLCQYFIFPLLSLYSFNLKFKKHKITRNIYNVYSSNNLLHYLFCAMFCRVVLRRVVSCRAAPSCPVLSCRVVSCLVLPCRVVWSCCVVLSCAVLRCVELCCLVLWHVALWVVLRCIKLR